MSGATHAGSGTIGIALGAERVWAAGASSAAVPANREGWWSRPLEPLAAGATEWASLKAALAELRKTRGDPASSLAIALLAPLAQVRMLELPPLKADDAQRVVAKTAGRYFLGVTEPQIVRVAGGAGDRPGETGVPAGAAATRVVEAIYRAATDAGWSVRTIAPAHEAWIAASRALWPALRGRAAQILVLGEHATDVIVTRDAAMARLRQFRDVQTDAARIAEALSEHPERLNGSARQPVATFGPSRTRTLVNDHLRPTGLTLAAPEARWTSVAESPEGAAATFASDASVLALMPETAMAERRERARNTTKVLAVAATGMFLVGAVLLLWGNQRQLERIRAQRAEVASQVRSVTQARDTVSRLTRRVTALRAAADGAARWSSVLGNVAQNLPADAYLTTFRAEGDSITLNGVAQQAAPAIEALQRTPGVTRVTQFGQIRRAAVLGGETAEQFSVRAYLPGATPAPAARGRAGTPATGARP